ncbi:MAG: DNA mismatch repair protein MutS [Flavobacterium sp.]|nr:MAG: DNA mismatch repair protein MutS [Flavobacterium sp.]
MFVEGDHVAVLDEAISGVVISVTDHNIEIETGDGFTLNYHPHELVKISDGAVLKNINMFEIRQASRLKDVPNPKKNVTERVRGEIPPPDFDLHIEKLTKNHRSLSSFEILDLQVETARRHIDFAIRNRIPKIVLIHGVGEGVLKEELNSLFSRYDNLTHREANYQKYGLGATELIFRQ